jgi:hypothetical protein
MPVSMRCLINGLIHSLINGLINGLIQKRTAYWASVKFSRKVKKPSARGTKLKSAFTP